MFSGTSGGLFGSSNANTSGSLFGQQQQKPSLFGGGGTTTGTGFGQTATTQSSLFGGNTANQGSSLFGAKPATGGGLFGTPATSSAFGAGTQSSGLFGQQQKPAFGQTQTSTPSLFGSSTTTTGFGGGFGAASSIVGTTQKFEPVIGTDQIIKNGSSQTTQTRLMVITAMKPYENKSLEELRIEDYMANRKGGTGGTAPAASSMFSSQTQQQTAPATGLFGASTSNTGGSLFGQQQPKPSLFGGGGTTTGTGFGQTATTQSSSLFGSTTATQGSSLFGAKPATGGSLFGTPATSSAFGAGTQSSGLFGQQQKPAFGQTQTSTPSLFGQQQQKPSLFGGGGTTTGTGFVQAATTQSSLFGGNTATQGGSLFGPKPAVAGGGLFGAPATSSAFGVATQPSGLFGQQQKPFGQVQTSTPSLFGGAAAPVGGFGGGYGATTTVTQALPAAQPIVLGSDVNQYNVQKAFLDAVVSNMPYGDSPLLRGSLSGAGLAKDSDNEKDGKDKLISQQNQAAFLAMKKAELSTTFSGYSSPRISHKLPPIGADLYKNRGSPSVRSVGTPSVKATPPVDKKANSTLKKALDKSGHNNSVLQHSLDGDMSTSRRRQLKALDPAIFKSKRNTSVSSKQNDSVVTEDDNCPNSSVDATNFVPTENGNTTTDSNNQIAESRVGNHQERTQSPVAISKNTQSSTAEGLNSENRTEPHPAGISLTRSDFYTVPSLEEMRQLTDSDGICQLKDGLTIGRLGFGSIYWAGPLSLSNIVIDEVVNIRNREVTVYPDDCEKPECGNGLNRPAEISLERVWPVDKSSRAVIKDSQKLLEMGFDERLERNCKKMGATFKDYRADTGTWVFAVAHFSKYGFDEDDDDEISPEELAALRKQRALQTVFQRAPKAVALKSLAASELDAIREEQENIPERPLEKRSVGLGGKLGAMDINDDELGNRSTYLDITNVESVSSRANRSAYLNLDESQVDAKRRRVENESAKVARILESYVECEEDMDSEEDESVSGSSGTPRPVNPFPEEEDVVLESRQPRFRTTGLVSYNRSLLAGREGLKSVYMQSLRKARDARLSWHKDLQFVDKLVPASNDALICQMNMTDSINPAFFSSAMRDLSEYSCTDGVGYYGPSKKPVDLVEKYIEASKACDEKSAMELTKILFTINDAKKQREEFGTWLRAEIAEEFKLKNREPQNFFDLLIRGDLKEAQEKAVSSGQPYMAMQMAAFTNKTEAIRLYSQEQLRRWNATGAAEHIGEPVLKTTMLLAGEMVWNREILNLENGKTQKDLIAVNSDLTWTQTLGLILWYIGGPNTSVQTAMESFREAASLGLVKMPKHCIVFELLQLATTPSYDIRQVLAPVNVGEDPLDFHLVWHLWNVISSAYGADAVVPEDFIAQLHNNYAQQLGALNYVEYSIFVYMHVKNPNARIRLLNDMFTQIAPKVNETLFASIHEICRLTDYEMAKARFARAQFTDDKTALYVTALESRQYDLAHKLFIEHIAPEAIANDDISEFEGLCVPLTQHSNKLEGWATRGQLFVDFCMMRILLAQQKNAELLQKLAQSLVERLSELDAKTPMQRLAASIMSKFALEVHFKLTGNVPNPSQYPLQFVEDDAIFVYSAIVPEL